MEEKKIRLFRSKSIHSLYSQISKSHVLLLTKGAKKYKHFAQDWELIQLICSWQKLHKENSLVELFPGTEIDGIHEQDTITLIASYISKNVECDGKDVKSQLMQHFKDHVWKMNGNLNEYLKGARGRKYTFLCLGGSKNEFLQWFYTLEPNPKIRNEMFIRSFIKSVIEKNKKEMLGIDAITQCVYEFFSNTDKHGRDDINNTPIDKSIRGISFHDFNFTDSDKDPSLEWSQKFASTLSDQKKMYSITVFDNGEGIIKKFYEGTTQDKEKNLDYERKKTVLKKVFKKGATSSSIRNSGIGLHYAKKCIEEIKGAYIIKCNGIGMYYTPNTSGVYEYTFIELPQEMAGTLITILIPR